MSAAVSERKSQSQILDVTSSFGVLAGEARARAAAAACEVRANIAAQSQTRAIIVLSRSRGCYMVPHPAMLKDRTVVFVRLT